MIFGESSKVTFYAEVGQTFSIEDKKKKRKKGKLKNQKHEKQL